MKKYVSEMLGTAFLVVMGCGTAALIGCDVTGGYLATALAFGLAIVALAYSVGNISGGHVNPAVSCAMWVSKKLDTKDLIGYIVAQVIGAFIGAGILAYILGVDSGLGANALYEGDAIKSLIIEIVLTFIFVIAIIGVTDSGENKFAGIVIGLVLTGVHILGIGLTGTSVNPARTLAPAILTGNVAGLWVFIVGPIVGGVLAAVVYKAIKE